MRSDYEQLQMNFKLAKEELELQKKANSQLQA